MYSEEFDTEDEEPSSAGDEAGIDFETEQVDIRSEDEVEELSPESPADNVDPSLDDALAEFVEFLNARDLEALGELLTEDVQAEFLEEGSRDGVVDGFNDLILRYPALLATRGDIGPDPIVVLWLYDQEENRFDSLGYISAEPADSGEGLIQRIDYVDELPDSEDVVVEVPEPSELSEWDEWSELDEE